MFQYKKIIVGIFSALFIFSNTTFAANWVYLQRQEGTRYGPCTEYFDVDSVVKDKDKIIVWRLWVLDESKTSNQIKKILFKQEVLLDQPMKQGNAATYTYDTNDQEIRRYSTVTPGFYEVQPNSMEENSIERVLLYAQEGKEGDSAEPSHILPPERVWYKAADISDGQLYLDLTSLVVWPHHSINKLEVTAKVIWNEQSLEKRKVQLAELSKKRYPLAYEKVSYTLLSYQFLPRENRSRIFEVTDYDDTDDRITLLDGIEWQDIEEDSRDKAVLQAVLSAL